MQKYHFRHVTLILLISLICLTTSLHASNENKKRIKATSSGKTEGDLIVDEKNLRKLSEIINTRMFQKTKDTNILYTVRLKNELEYETTNINDLLTDENTKISRIQSIEITSNNKPNEVKAAEINVVTGLQSNDQYEIKINLSKEGASYLIFGADRDWVINTQVDISERLQNMVHNKHWHKLTMAFKLFCAVCAFFLTLMPFAYKFRNRHNKIMRESNPNYPSVPIFKYIFTFQDPFIKKVELLVAFQIWLIASIVVFFASDWFLSILYPPIVFLIGEQITEYENILKIRNYIINGIAIAFVISILSSLIANKISKRVY